MQLDTQPCLESVRLILRPFVMSDARDTQLLAGNYAVAKETMHIPFPYEDGMAEEWISSLDKKWRNEECAAFAIEEKGGSKLIGCMSFVALNKTQAEIGYWIGVPYWGKGFCTEAGKLLVEYGLREMSLRKITGIHLSSNPVSGKVLENIGLVWQKNDYGPDRNGNNVKFEFYETP